ncbi:hypothetical protein B6U99_01990 [Candidatus Geothermarchaeota archaeon ex4572_27]|nr:MAG: hypothetical protein B6U99_01990 [Candidatus Geothermarchaeota archaeon ex4572_27]
MGRRSRVKDEIKRLHEMGLSDEEISSRLGISIWTVRYWRRRFRLGANPSARKCQICGKEFRGRGRAKYCPDCRAELRKIRGIQFQMVRKIRYHLYYLLEHAPETFKKVVGEIEREEGPEFARMLLKGMLEKRSKVILSSA